VSAPVLEPEAARLYQQLLPMAGDDEANGYATAHLCAVLKAPIERVARIALDQGEASGYSSLLNVDDCDAEDLPWLGQFNGTALSGSEPEEEARRLIREARGSHRGTPSALLSDLMATLTGAKSVQVLERVGSPFENRFVVQEGEMPDERPSLAALNDRTTKPLGTVNTIEVGIAPTWDNATRTWNEVTATWDDATAADLT
jgi:hypothetical protein